MPMESEERETFACGRLLAEGLRSFSDSYTKEKFLGRGAFAEVWVCKEKETGKEFACKIFEKKKIGSESEKADVQREVALLQALKGKHQAIVQLHEMLETEVAVYAVMELCRGGDLFDLLKHNGKLPEPAARLVFKQLASAVAFCHARGVIHRDIKPENILFEAPADRLYLMEPRMKFQAHVQAKLSDFGLAVVLRPGATTGGYTGSRYYTAPEMIRGKEYGRRTDIWSLGVVLCAMLTGRLPFAGKGRDDDEGLMRAILSGKVNFNSPSWNGVSEAAMDLVSKMLQSEPQKRLKSCEILAHPWLVSPFPWATDLAALQLDALISSARAMGLMPEEPKQKLHLASASADFSGRSGPLAGPVNKHHGGGKRRFQRSETVILEGKKLAEDRAKAGGGGVKEPKPLPRSETLNMTSTRGQAEGSTAGEDGRGGFWRGAGKDQHRKLVARSGTFDASRGASDMSGRSVETEGESLMAQGVEAVPPSSPLEDGRGNGGANLGVNLGGYDDRSGSLKKASSGLSDSRRNLSLAPAQSKENDASSSSIRKAPSLGSGRAPDPTSTDVPQLWQQEGMKSPPGVSTSAHYSTQSSSVSVHSSAQYSAYSNSVSSGGTRSVTASSQSSAGSSSHPSKSVLQKIGSQGTKLWGAITRKIHPHGKADGGGVSPRIPASRTIEGVPTPPVQGDHPIPIPIPKIVTRDIPLAVNESALHVRSAGMVG